MSTWLEPGVLFADAGAPLSIQLIASFSAAGVFVGGFFALLLNRPERLERYAAYGAVYGGGIGLAVWLNRVL